MSAAGAHCKVHHTDGGATEGHFPETIAPHQPFMAIRSIEHKLLNGTSVKVTLQGDTFEMEDQRNWTDASFKTYCTPLELPFPVEVEKGTKIKQEIIVKLNEVRTESTTTNRALKFALMRYSSNLPSLGLGAARRPLKPKEIERLKTLNLDHLRLDLDLQVITLKT